MLPNLIKKKEQRFNGNFHIYVYHNILNDTDKNEEIGKNVIDTDEENQNVDDNESFVHQEIQ